MSAAKRSDIFDESSAIILQSTERHKMAKKKRLLQLKRYNQYEKQLEKSKKSNPPSSKNSTSCKGSEKRREVRFVGRVRLLEAAARNDIEEVRQLLEAGVSPDVTNDDGLTAMHQCCIDNFEDMLCLLIEHGAKINACDSELWTPLHASAACGHLNLCKHLINNGADLMAVNCDGMMAYDICDNEATLDFIETEMTKRGITQQVIDETRNLRELNMLRDLKELTRQGYDLDWRGKNGETFQNMMLAKQLHIASCNGYLEVTQFLLQHPSVNIDAADHELWQPVHCAVCWNQLGVLELLLVHGASLEAKTRNGETALDICEDEDLRQQIEEMRDHWQRNKPVRSRDLLHKPSSVRSSSVRRSSMKQKKATSMKEALEEGKLLTIGSMATAATNGDKSNSLDDDVMAANKRNNSKKSKNNFEERGSGRQTESTSTKHGQKDTQQPPSPIGHPNAGNGNGPDKDRPGIHHMTNRDLEQGGSALLAKEGSSPMDALDLPRTRAVLRVPPPSPHDDSDNNNTTRLHHGPLPSALKKTNQPQSSSSSSITPKSDKCCVIV